MTSLPATRRMTVSLTALAIAAAALLAVPSGAQAAYSCMYDPATRELAVWPAAAGDSTTIAVSGTGITVDGAACPGAPTTSNVGSVRVSGVDGGDERVTLDLGGGAFAPGAPVGEASGSTPEIELDVQLGTGNDYLTVRGGAGADTMTAGALGVALNGDADVDLVPGGVDLLMLRGSDGADRLSAMGGLGTGAASPMSLQVNISGDGGDDTLQPGVSWGESVCGGSGRDVASYASRSTPVAISLNGTSDDGATGEGDNVGCLAGDVEDLVGSPNADVLAGNSVANVLRPGGGDDVVSGGEGNDTMVADADADGRDAFSGGLGRDVADYSARAAGVTLSLDGVANDGRTGAGEGDDVQADVECLRGSAAADRIYGNPLANTLNGMGGNDLVTGFGGADVLAGGDGNDILYARDGAADKVSGGSGTDRARVDASGIRDALTSIESLLA